MSNSYFRFKQFTVHQDKCAMKVCTDACLFGAYVAERLGDKDVEHKKEDESPADQNPQFILDIGTGTGLLSLMLAQKVNALIDAVEIDKQAVQQATENFERSPWKERIKVFHSSIQSYIAPHGKYDFIITNPPFFENDLKSPQSKRNIALHSTELSLQDLITQIKRLLAKDGSFAVLLPYHRAAYFEKLAEENGFFNAEKVLVKQTPRHDYFRAILLFEAKLVKLNHHEIIIHDENGKYTKAFAGILKDYYLNL